MPTPSGDDRVSRLAAHHADKPTPQDQHDALEQRMFLRDASVSQFIERAEAVAEDMRVYQSLPCKPMVRWVAARMAARYRAGVELDCLRRAREIQPGSGWNATATECRGALADAAGTLYGALQTLDADADRAKALERFLAALQQLRDEMAGAANVPAHKPKAKTVRAKRSTSNGDAHTKLIAALTLHHKYADGHRLNLEPIGNNVLARAAGVAPATATRFFGKWFGGYAKYSALCRRSTNKLIDTLKAMNGEFIPTREPNYGADPDAGRG